MWLFSIGEELSHVETLTMKKLELPGRRESMIGRTEARDRLRRMEMPPRSLMLLRKEGA